MGNSISLVTPRKVRLPFSFPPSCGWKPPCESVRVKAYQIEQFVRTTIVSGLQDELTQTQREAGVPPVSVHDAVF